MDPQYPAPRRASWSPRFAADRNRSVRLGARGTRVAWRLRSSVRIPIALPWQASARRQLRDAARKAGARRDLRIAIIVAIAALLAVLAGVAHAEPLDAVVRARVTPALAPGLDVAKVYLPANLAALDVDPARVAIELPHELRAGRPSVKLILRGRTSYVPVAIAAAGDVAVAQRAFAPGDVIGPDDIAIEHRAIADIVPALPAALIGSSVTSAIAAGAPIAARDVVLAPPLPRGTQVEIDLRRGAVHIRGTATLEVAARPGAPASARLAATKIVVHGTLVAPATLVVGD